MRWPTAKRPDVRRQQMHLIFLHHRQTGPERHLLRFLLEQRSLGSQHIQMLLMLDLRYAGTRDGDDHHCPGGCKSCSAVPSPIVSWRMLRKM